LEEEGSNMVKKNDLSCVFTPATGEAVILKDGKPVVEGRDLKTSDGGILDRALGVKPGDDYFGKASIPGVGDPDKATAKFHVFKMNAESMGCSVPELGIENVRAPRVSASAPAFKP
jgi:hypothetical protein